MKAGSLLCLLGILALSQISLQADSDSSPVASLPAKKVPDTLLGKYKQYVYQVVGSYWYPQVDQAFASLQPGTVRIRYTIFSDGTLHDVQVIEGKKLTKLVDISMNAVMAPQPFRPFTPNLVKEVGDKFTDDFTFSIKGDSGTSNHPPANTISGPSPYSML